MSLESHLSHGHITVAFTAKTLGLGLAFDPAIVLITWHILRTDTKLHYEIL